MIVLAAALAPAATTTTTTAAPKASTKSGKAPAAKTPAPAAPTSPADAMTPAPTPPASAFAPTSEPAPAAPTAPAPVEPAKTFPYAGYINVQESGGTVYVRAGPGTYYYPLTNMAKNTPVMVQVEVNGWCAVAPPAGVYGLVKKADVAVSADSKTAKVAADDVRVFASSDTAKRQWDVMAVVKKDDTLKVLGSAEGDLVKVAPPETARVYVSAQFVAAGPSPTGGVAVDVKIEPIKPDPMLENLKKAEEALADEVKKPMGQRDYAAVTAALKEVVEKAEKPYVKQAAEARLAEVTSLEARQADFKKAEAIDLELKKKIANIQTDAADKAASNEAEKKAVRPDFVAKGMVLRLESAADVDYPVKFKLVDQKNVALFVLKSDAFDLSKYVGKVVGVRGEKTWLKDWSIYLILVDDIEVLE
jgi:SH3-like domain-containing protein